METEQEMRSRKALLVAPFVVLPSVLLLFYALGGGEGSQPPAEKAAGINTSVPAPHLKETSLDKLSLYRKADKDSLSAAKAAKSDPYARHAGNDQDVEDQTEDFAWLEGQHEGSRRRPAHSPDAAERRARAKLDALQRELERSTQPDAAATAQTPPTPAADADALLAAMQQQMHAEAAMGAEANEIDQINTMLEKVLDIKHPQRVTARLQQQEAAADKLALSVAPAGTRSWSLPLESRGRGHVLDTGAGRGNAVGMADPSVGFFELKLDTATAPAINAIRAEITHTQQLVSGATVALRLVEPVILHGMTIEKGTLLSGTGKLSGNRFQIEVTAIAKGNAVLPVKLVVHDLQGMPGISIQGALSRDVAGREASSTLQNMQLMTLDPSLSAQAIGAGIETAKGIFSRKAKLVKVTLKAGPVLLVDKSKR